MSITPTKRRSVKTSETDEYSFVAEDYVADGLNGQWILFPDGVEGASVDLIIVSGSGHVENTNDALELIEAGTAVGYDWPQGVVTSSQGGQWLRPVNAFRAVSDAGPVNIKVRFA